MSATFKVLGFGGVAAVAQVAVSLIHAAVTAPVPPVQMTHLGWNGYAVVFERTVHSDIPIRASVQNEIVDIETEQTVDGCLLVPPRRADFTPQETRKKVFSMAQFVSQECQDALIEGRSYGMITVVVPLGGGEPTAMRSEPFVWTGVSAP